MKEKVRTHFPRYRIDHFVYRKVHILLSHLTIFAHSNNVLDDTSVANMLQVVNNDI